MVENFAVGDRVHSMHGTQHVGTVIKVAAFSSGEPMIHVRRDVDGFVWIGWPGTMLRAAALN